MSNFQSRFDAQAVEARRSFVNRGAEIRKKIARFYGSDFERLLASISKLLEKVDKNSVDHPEYLAHTTGHVGEYAISLITNLETSFESGVDHFVQTILPGLLVCEEKLNRAVGNYYYNVKEVKDRYVKELQKLTIESRDFHKKAREAKGEIENLKSEYEDALEKIAASNGEADDAINAIASIRDRAARLASGDGRGKSLEALKRRAESKLETIEDMLAKGVTAQSEVIKALDAVHDAKGDIEIVVRELEGVRSKANEILALSNQAGLASSYLTEGRTLGRKSFYFTIILYVASAATLALALFYVIPTLEPATNGTTVVSQNTLLLTLLRATILAPLVYVIYFTTKRISALETLRMDYAEKAAASLAYSGYKDELSVDETLLDQLRGSLLLRFAEHPERLLRKSPASESLKIRLPGFSATSKSSGTNGHDEESSSSGGSEEKST